MITIFSYINGIENNLLKINSPLEIEKKLKKIVNIFNKIAIDQVFY